MTSRGRPRVHLFSGGPTWEVRASERHARKALEQQRLKKLTRKHRAALRELDAGLDELRVALRRKELERARSLRSVAWERVERLPQELTGPQRRTLFDCKLLIRDLAAARRGDG